MPKALKLSVKTIPLIADEIDVDASVLWDDLGTANDLDETRYFVTNITINNIAYPWINVREDYFMEHFNYVEGHHETQFEDVIYIP